MSQPAKRFKPTVAANAEAIAALGQQMSGVDGRLESITLMLANLSAGGQTGARIDSPGQQLASSDSNNIALNDSQPTLNLRHAQAGAPAIPLGGGQQSTGHASTNTQAAQFGAAQPAQPDWQRGMTPGPPLSHQQLSQQLQQQPTQTRPAATTHFQPFPAATAGGAPGALQAFPGTTAASAAATAAATYTPDPAQLVTTDPFQRHRHFTTGHQPQAWPGTTGTILNPLQTGLHQQPDLLQPALHPWDRPTTLQDLEADPHMTHRVTQALHAMTTPFAAGTGKHAHFPHQLVDRGTKKQKTALGELTLPEYLWGFIQLIKAKEPNHPDVPFMYAHMERITEDAKTYDWSSVRAWSEEILVRIYGGKLVWSNSYEIDRLQTQFSHQYKPDTPASDSVHKSETGYKMSESLKRAKPGPPCKPYQASSCTQTADHINNGYRQLHVCTYCLSNKCELHPHSLSECKTKKFNEEKRAKKESGFGHKNNSNK